MEFTINGKEFWVDEFPEGYNWQSNGMEGDRYHATPAEAQQACMDDYTARVKAEEEAEEERRNDEAYGTEQEQITRYYNSITR